MFHQLLRFIIIGGGCAVIDFGTYSLLLGVLGWPVWLSKSISFILGTTASYLINRRFTFHGANTGNTKAKAGAFAVLYTITFFVNMGSTSCCACCSTPRSPGSSPVLGHLPNWAP